MSNVGLWGTALILAFAWRLRRRYKKALIDMKPAAAITARSASYSVLAMLLAGAVAVPDISWLTLWLNLGVLVGLLIEGEGGSRATLER